MALKRLPYSPEKSHSKRNLGSPVKNCPRVSLFCLGESVRRGPFLIGYDKLKFYTKYKAPQGNWLRLKEIICPTNNKFTPSPFSVLQLNRQATKGPLSLLYVPLLDIKPEISYTNLNVRYKFKNLSLFKPSCKILFDLDPIL